MAALVASVIEVLDAVDPNIVLTISLGVLATAGVALWKKTRR